jgi:PAS domain S-box-containing protein
MDAPHEGDSIYRMLFKSAGDAIFVQNGDKILAVNRKACEMLGYAEDELLSMRPGEINVAEQRMYMPEHMAKLKKHEIVSFESIYQKKDGTAVPVEVTARSITWDGEQEVISICRDNTSKKNYDNILLNVALEWQQVFDAIKDAVLLLSPDYRILRCNKASCNMFSNGRPGEILGKLCWEVVHGALEQNPTCPIRVMRKTKKRATAVLESGGRWLEITVDPVFDESNNISGVLHVVSDITGRRRLESEKAELEERNRQLQKFESLDLMAGSIASCFKNQLQVVLGYLELAVGDLSQGDPRVIKLSRVLAAARKISEVSNLLLAYLGQVQVKSDLFDLAGLCRMSLPALREGKPGNVVLETDLPSSGGPVINADPKLIRQLLTSLAVNAWESIGDGTGTVRLGVRTLACTDIPTLHRFPVEWRPKGQTYACLEVRDSGCGITEKDMDRIFDPFFSTKLTGMGLGLAVVLGIVRAHDLVITVESGICDGSIFRVFFPLSAQTEIRQDEPALCSQ